MEEALRLPIAQPRVDFVEGALLQVQAEKRWALEVRGMNLESEGKPLLRDVDLCLDEGELVAIVGEVGSGKSLLLQSLMGATGAYFARFSVSGIPTRGPGDPSVRQKFAYVPQEGFTMSATLRENVLLTYLDRFEADPERDARILESLSRAQFIPEVERVTDGLETEIGERGVNLSGGQRQRISMARAHFANRSLILLDDCLSAVDVETEKRLIRELICDSWKDRTRLLVTHRMTILPICDRVLFMEDGKITLQGTYADLVIQSPRFNEFVRRETIRVAAPSILENQEVAENV